jgi:hypothetical protein
MPHPKFQMLQDDAAAAAPAAADAGGDVVFPDDYPNSVKHFLMLGAIGFLIGAVVFLTLNFMRVRRSLAHSVSTGTGAQAQAQAHRHRHGAGAARGDMGDQTKRVRGAGQQGGGGGKLADPQPPAHNQTQATFIHP